VRVVCVLEPQADRLSQLFRSASFRCVGEELLIDRAAARLKSRR